MIAYQCVCLFWIVFDKAFALEKEKAIFFNDVDLAC